MSCAIHNRYKLTLRVTVSVSVLQLITWLFMSSATHATLFYVRKRFRSFGVLLVMRVCSGIWAEWRNRPEAILSKLDNIWNWLGPWMCMKLEDNARADCLATTENVERAQLVCWQNIEPVRELLLYTKRLDNLIKIGYEMKFKENEHADIHFSWIITRSS